ncbi:hypothetical protein [Sphingomonas sp. UBA978]|uniref:hypothetical protein n=1 Tax=Sphingomonas sp. UBA978 TaxID=1947536 RepID=UPI0025E401EC|nr:hypothetical protein [Sphingomonas sp. UBA978]
MIRPIAVALLAVAQAPPADEISVVGRRLRKLQLDLNIDAGQLRGCRARVSSGDRFIDEAACSAARICVGRRSVARTGLLTCINEGVFAAVARDRAKEESRNAQD